MQGCSIGHRVYGVVVWVSLAILTAGHAIGQVIPATATTVVPAAQSTDISHLEVGDKYEIVVERQGVKKQYSGTLVKMNDRWLVLHSVVEGRTEQGVPLVSKLPSTNKRLFRNVGIGRANQFYWIPREAAVVQGRSMSHEKRELLTPQGDEPTSGSQCWVDVVKDGKVVDGFSTITLGDEYLKCHLHFTKAVDHPSPVLGKLPIIGNSFKTRIYKTEELNLQFRWNDVMCISEQADEILPPEVKAEP